MNAHTDTARSILAGLQQALRDYTAGRRDGLFQSRALMTRLSDAVGKADREYVVPVCEAVQRVLGNVLVHGAMKEHDAILLAQELLQFVRVALEQPAPGHGIDMAAGERPPLPGFASRLPGGVSAYYDMIEESRIGEILIKMGSIDKNLLQRALTLQQVHRKRLGEILMAMGAIDSHQLDAALERQRSLSVRLSGGGQQSGLELRLGDSSMGDSSEG